MSRQRLLFEPESIESLRARYPQAIAELLDIESIGLGLAYDPGVFRKHVFDLEDGIRLIISREYQEEGKVIHWSASVDKSFSEKFSLLSFVFIIDFIERKFREISGDQRPLYLFAVSADEIPHWYILEDTSKKYDLGEITFKV